MTKKLLFKAIVTGITAGTIAFSALTPLVINANTSGTAATLVHNGRLTICKLDRSHYEVTKTIKGAVVTGYSSTKDQTDSTPFITASGLNLKNFDAEHGVVATNILPLGTMVRINGDIYKVEDRMNAKYNGKKRFDIWFPGEELGKKEAIKWGAQIFDIEVLES